MCLDSMIRAAKKEDWRVVDKLIPTVCNDPAYVEWAFVKGIADSDGNIRDLAVSILEKTKKLTLAMKKRLYELMKTDTNTFVKYRSAFALRAHDPAYYRREVNGMLKKATDNPDVSEIALKYLRKNRV